MKLTMKINLIPTKKLALLSVAFFAVAMLAFSPNAHAVPLDLTFTDTHVLGTITPANPADHGDVVNYVNFMIGLAPGGSGNFTAPPPPPNNIQHITRSLNTFASLPTANDNVFALGGKNDTTINLGAGGVYSYLFAKYDGQNDISQVWYVGNLTGIITIPAFGPNNKGLSGWILFGPGGTVPDGGTTVMLLGVALSTLGMARRFLKK
jgi:hypothetical protein